MMWGMGGWVDWGLFPGGILFGFGIGVLISWMANEF